jgi:TolB-like protein
VTKRIENEAAETNLGALLPTSTPASATGSADEPAPGLVAERYEVLGLLGVGGMGRVYRVRDRKLDEVVALKVLRRELVAAAGMLERFLQEVKLARRVTSPHVVRTFDVGQHGADHFLTMEYLEGQSLAQLLDRGLLGVLPIDEAVRIASAASEGIAAAHAAGVLHRDLKPDNVLVAKSGRIAITDFGIARTAAHGSPLETGGRVLGTPAYMAPEQVLGSPTIGPPADVYAFGVMLYEMLTGKRAFPGDDPLAVAAARLHQPPPDPSRLRALPSAITELVLRCLAREPASRYSDGIELARALAELDIGLAATGRLPSLSQRPELAPLLAEVPAKAARLIAVLPFRSPPDLVDVAGGLSEEIIDTLSMTRGLRVRPLASVRRAGGAEIDPRTLGAALGVDVVVEGSVRRLPTALRVTARAIGVADGFQLWANRTDAPLEALLTISDELANAIARALTIELDAPVRPVAASARATELYLEGKRKLRADWWTNGVAEALPFLVEAHQLAPSDPTILSAYSLLLSRLAFFGVESGDLAAARALAERAIALAPHSGEAWLALGVSDLYGSSIADAAFALSRAVARAPGLALAHAALGGMVVEAGVPEEGIAHLEAAIAIDASEPQPMWESARAHALAGRHDAAEALLASHPEYETSWRQILTRARFRTWRGEATSGLVFDPAAGVPPPLARYYALVLPSYGSRTMSDETLAALVTLTAGIENPRNRAVRSQYVAELFLFCDREEAAAAAVETAVDAGLQDLLWMDRCPLLAPLRVRPSFALLREKVAVRAEAVLAAVRSARA